MNDAFWRRLDALVDGAEPAIDRPKGSAHPRYPETIYPLDYGHLLGTTGGDGNPVDVWVGSLENRTLDAIICTVDLEKKDVEVKLLLGCTDEEKRIALEFHSGKNAGGVLVER